MEDASLPQILPVVSTCGPPAAISCLCRVTAVPCSVVVAGPVAWNSLPVYLREPTPSGDSFRRDLKTFLFSLY